MKMDREEFIHKGLFSSSRIGPAELTHQLVEGYLSKGRYLKSLYIVALLKRPGRVLKAIHSKASRWLFMTPGSINVAVRYSKLLPRAKPKHGNIIGIQPS